MPRPRKGDNPGYIFPVRLTPAFERLIKTVAYMESTTASDLIREAVADYLATLPATAMVLKSFTADPKDFPTSIALLLNDIREDIQLSLYFEQIAKNLAV